MAQLRSGPALLKAIEGFRGETSGSKQHEEMNAILSRVHDEIHKGSAPPHDSPGRREATSAAHREMPAEHGHSGGDGQATANERGSAGPPQEERNIAPGRGDSDERLSAVVPPSRGNRVANASASFPPSSVEGIRRIAAEREKSRPDSKWTVKAKTSEDVRANAPGPAREDAARIGAVSTPPARGGSSEPEARSAARGSDKQPEAKPPYAQESIGDSFMRASVEAKKRLAKK